MSWNCTAYFLDAWALLLTERVIVLRVYAAHACSFNYKSDYSGCFFCMSDLFVCNYFDAAEVEPELKGLFLSQIVIVKC